MRSSLSGLPLCERKHHRRGLDERRPHALCPTMGSLHESGQAEYSAGLSPHDLRSPRALVQSSQSPQPASQRNPRISMCCTSCCFCCLIAILSAAMPRETVLPLPVSWLMVSDMATPVYASLFKCIYNNLVACPDGQYHVCMTCVCIRYTPEMLTFRRKP